MRLSETGNYSRFVPGGRSSGVVSEEGFDVITQTPQKIELVGTNAQEIESRLQQILESMRVNPPWTPKAARSTIRTTTPTPTAPRSYDTAAYDTASPDDDGQAPVGFPPFMRLPTQNHSVTRLGQAMVDRGIITQDHLEQALDHQRTTGKRLGESLVDIGAVTSFELSQALADHLGVPFVDLQAQPPDVLLAGMLPEEVARRYCALPIEPLERSARHRDGEPERPLRARRPPRWSPASRSSPRWPTRKTSSPRSSASYRVSDVETHARRARRRLRDEGRRSQRHVVDEGPVVGSSTR